MKEEELKQEEEESHDAMRDAIAAEDDEALKQLCPLPSLGD